MSIRAFFSPVPAALERRAAGRITTMGGRLVDPDSRAAAYAALEWAGHFRDVNERVYAARAAAIQAGVSDKLALEYTAVLAGIQQYLGIALEVAGELYERHGMHVDDQPASLRARPLIGEYDQHRDRWVERWRTPADWRNAGRRLRRQAAAFIEGLPPAPGGLEQFGASDGPMGALPALWVVYLVGAAAIGAVVYGVATYALDGVFAMFGHNARALRMAEDALRDAYNAQRRNCDRLPPAERARCTEEAASAFIEGLEDAQDRFGLSGFMKAAIAAGAFGLTALLLSRSG